MKNLAILILIIITIFAEQRAWSSQLEATSLESIEQTDKELELINVKFQNPLNDVDANLETYSTLLNLFSNFKKFDVTFATGLLNKVKNEQTLSGSELYLLRRTTSTYYKINKKILDFAKVYDFGEFNMAKTIGSDQQNIQLIKAHLIWLSGHLLVIDHLESMHAILYETDGEFRRIVKNALIEKSDSFEGTNKTLDDLLKMNQYAVEIAESLKFAQQINLVRGINEDLKTILSNETISLNLVEAIVNNQTAIDISRGKKEFSLKHFTFIDTTITVVNKVAGWLSKIFGNIAGSIHWRKGYLYENNTVTELAKSKLQPMDVLLEKSPFTLTDKFIPGHFGHAAIYLGTKEQLESIGMWNHPDIIPYQNDIANGKIILEAVRTGVRLNTLEDFLNIDEFTIIRKQDALESATLLTEEITRGMDQIGKAYDFNFDITTLDKIVCSELVYIFYGNVKWNTQYRLGRATITPDDIAEILFQKNTKFKVTNFTIAKESNQIKQVDLDYISDDFDYELRNSNGDPVESKEDQSNSYWKKETKCYTVANINFIKGTEAIKMKGEETNRLCKTSYKEFQYEEKQAL